MRQLGALHGLETLLQLMQNNGSSFIFRQEVTDSPIYLERTDDRCSKAFSTG
jgi:hexosaminidase